MNTRIILGLLFGLIAWQTYSQDSTILTTTIKIQNVEQILLDNFNNIYVLEGKNKVIQYDINGTQKAIYNELRYGDLKIIDLNNPLSIMLYFPSFSMVQILDRNLSLQSEINLMTLGFQTNTAIGLGADNNIWFYNQEKSRLIKLDPSGKVLRKSNELIGLIGNSTVAGQIWEQDNFILAQAPGFGWMLFDDFGSYIQTLPIPDHEIQYFKNGIITYLKNDAIKLFDLNTLRTKTLPIPQFINLNNSLQYLNGMWIEKSPESINIYRLPE